MDYTPRLRQQMTQAGLESLRALYRAAQVSPGVVKRLRAGQVSQMRLDTLIKLSRALGLSLSDLIQAFSGPSLPGPSSSDRPDSSKFNRQPSSEGEASTLPSDAPSPEALQQFQRLSLQVLESWLLQWPTAVHAVGKAPEDRPIPASRLILLVTPVEQLIASWGVVPIGDVGQETGYDPHRHQLMDGQAQPGERVRVRYVGYRQGDVLLHRAKVSPA